MSFAFPTAHRFNKSKKLANFLFDWIVGNAK